MSSSQERGRISRLGEAAARGLQVPDQMDLSDTAVDCQSCGEPLGNERGQQVHSDCALGEAASADHVAERAERTEGTELSNGDENDLPW